MKREHAEPVDVSLALDCEPGHWTLNDYQWLITRTLNHKMNLPMGLMHSAALVASDAGEYLSGVKAFFFYDKPLDAIHDAQTGQTLRDNMIEEMGDVLWGLAEGAARLGVTLEDVARANQKKLIKRYPDKFSNAAAQARADKHPSVGPHEPPRVPNHYPAA